MAVYAFNYIRDYRDPGTNERKCVYGNYINDQLWCIWFPRPNEKEAHRILSEKAKELNAINAKTTNRT